MERLRSRRWRPDSLVFVAILLLGAALRLNDITQPLVDAHSWRQASTAMMADNFRLRSWNIFFPEVSWTGPGPSYQGREFQIISYITAILHQIFGWHDWFGRLVAVLFGLTSIGLAYLLVTRVWGQVHGWAAAAMMAIAPGIIVIDRSFLPDPAMLTFVFAAILLFVRFLEEERAKLLWMSGFFLTLGILAKMPGIAVGFVFTYLLLEEWATRNRPLTWLIRPTLMGVASLAIVFAYYGWAVYLGRSYPPYHVAGSGYVWQHGFLYFLNEGFFVKQLFGRLSGWYFGLPLLALAVAGFFLPPPSAARLRGRWLFHVWFAGFVLVFLAGAREIVNNPWNLLIGLAPLSIFAGRGLIFICGVFNRSPLMFVVRMAAIVLAVLIASHSAVQGVKAPYEHSGMLLGQKLDELAADDDLVVAVSSTIGDPIGIYYSRRRGWVFPPGGGDSDWSQLAGNEEALQHLDQLVKEGATWFGISRNATDTLGRLFLEHHAELIGNLRQRSTRVIEDEHYVIFHLRPPSRMDSSSPGSRHRGAKSANS